jgi:hypothetical protein
LLWLFFEIGSLVYTLVGLSHDLPIYTSYIVGMTGACHQAQLLAKMGISWMFLPGLTLWTMILPMSASWVARITGMRHYAWLEWILKDRTGSKWWNLNLVPGHLPGTHS